MQGSRHVDIRSGGCIVDARDRRIAPQSGGTELLSTHLRTNSRGSNTFKLLLHGLDVPT